MASTSLRTFPQATRGTIQPGTLRKSPRPAIRKAWFMRQCNKAQMLTIWTAAFTALLGGTIAAQEPHIRTIFRTAGPPIAERLIPGDEIVVITQDPEAGTVEGNVSAEQIIDLAARSSDHVAIVNVTKVEGVLTNGGSWIDT